MEAAERGKGTRILSQLSSWKRWGLGQNYRLLTPLSGHLISFLTWTWTQLSRSSSLVSLASSTPVPEMGCLGFPQHGRLGRGGSERTVLRQRQALHTCHHSPWPCLPGSRGYGVRTGVLTCSGEKAGHKPYTMYTQHTHVMHLHACYLPHTEHT